MKLDPSIYEQRRLPYLLIVWLWMLFGLDVQLIGHRFQGVKLGKTTNGVEDLHENLRQDAQICCAKGSW